ncbi:hypothetical protein HZ326_3960 [Fusarium oxysporum f. sp. albedinis]|nr:hypothetical protein HZ326_3960 [Fusarium oxysporum f. sp. albedinis]
MSFHPGPDLVCICRSTSAGDDLQTQRVHVSAHINHSINSMELANMCCGSFLYIHFVVVVVDSLSHAVIRSVLLVALSDVLALLDALALASAGGSILETLAMLVLALGEVSGLVSAVDTVRLK